MRNILFGLAVLAGAHGAAAATFPPVPAHAGARATLDLATTAGLAKVQGTWRYSDAHIVEVPFRAAGADRQPSGAPVMTHDVEPHAGAADFDDAAWPTIAPEALAHRRGNGRLSFGWYRLAFTVPDAIDGVPTRDGTLVFETTADDYAEIWVDGELPRAAAQSGGSVIAGWNAPNRLVVARGVQPGQTLHVAVFGANGPLSAPPTNYVYLRDANLELHAPDVALPYALPPHEVNVEVRRRDPEIDTIVPTNAKLYKLAEGFQFTEGPVWSKRENALYFSDPNANRIYRYDGELRVFREHSGYAGADIAQYRQPGSNGLTFDAQGRLVVNQHGNRRVVRLEADGRETVLAERDAGRRLNSPNDLVLRRDGSLYFTDPFFGLPQFGADPRKELPYQGVYRALRGKVELLTRELSGPNGIAFSPDEKFLYVGNWDDAHKVVMRYPVRRDGRLDAGTVFADLTREPGEDAIDGIKVDRAGHVYVSGPGGLWIYAADGRVLGAVVTPFHAHNFAWGDDGTNLYLAARSRLYRLPLLVAGAIP